MKQPLTKRQKKVLDCIINSIWKRGYAPSYREIGDLCGISSPNGVVCHMKALEAKGHIKHCRGPGGRRLSRAIVLVD